MNTNHKQLESGNTPPQLFFKLKKHKKKTKNKQCTCVYHMSVNRRKRKKKTTEKLNAGQYILHQ